MSVNKVQLANGETIIDISDSTVTPETLAEGVTAHDASGKKITGKMIPGGGASVQSDWNQTDETAADFIKNKPFEGKPTWEDIGIEEQAIFEEENAQFEDGQLMFETNANPGSNDTVLVEFDGTAYECFVLTDLGYPIFGDIGVMAGQPTGSPPFAGMFMDGMCALMLSGSTVPQSVKITVLKKIPIEQGFLPTLLSVFYLDQNDGYIAHDAFANDPVTMEELSYAISHRCVVFSYGNIWYSYPVRVDVNNGDYGVVYIMQADGSIQKYYTAEYTP